MKGFPALEKPLFEPYRSQQGLGEADLGRAKGEKENSEGAALEISWKSF